jgi:hypothetical protein
LLTELVGALKIPDTNRCSRQHLFSMAFQLIPYVFPRMKTPPTSLKTGIFSPASLIQVLPKATLSVPNQGINEADDSSNDKFPLPPNWSWTSTFLQKMRVNASKPCHTADDPLLFVRQVDVPVVSTSEGNTFLETAVSQSISLKKELSIKNFIYSAYFYCRYFNVFSTFQRHRAFIARPLSKSGRRFRQDGPWTPCGHNLKLI